MYRDERSEDLLCGMLLAFGDQARHVATRAGLRPWHLTQGKARATWEGKGDPRYLVYVSQAVIREWTDACLRVQKQRDNRVQGLEAGLYPLPDETDIVKRLATRLVRYAKARELLVEAERVAKGIVEPQVVGGVQL
ncbi:MAG: hypothetical protein WC683_08615 [bacterium]